MNTRARIIGVMLFCGAAAICNQSAFATGPAKQLWKWLPGGLHQNMENDPIGSIAFQMQGVVVDLNAVQTGAPVQANEKKVVSDLDELIEELSKQCKGNGGGNPNPTKPMASSTLAKGPGGSGPMHDAKEGTRVWGQLPPKLREQILQSQTEGFPPGYEAVLASYYAHLAQGQVPPDAADTSPTTKPAAP
jgi:hypothetical protein